MAGIGGCVFNNDRNQMINLRPSVQFRKMRAAYGVSGWRPVAFRIAFRRYAGGYPSHYGMCRLGSSMCGKVIRTARKPVNFRDREAAYPAYCTLRVSFRAGMRRISHYVCKAVCPGRRFPADVRRLTQHPHFGTHQDSHSGTHQDSHSGTHQDADHRILPVKPQVGRVPCGMLHSGTHQDSHSGTHQDAGMLAHLTRMDYGIRNEVPYAISRSRYAAFGTPLPRSACRKRHVPS